MQPILKYFPELTELQISRFEKLKILLEDWNSKINLISRQDIQELYLKHILHSLSIAKVVEFEPGTTIMDVGTGGGFPGIPLAILFPDSDFYLIDSIGKKIMVVNELIEKLGLENVKAEQKRAEEVPYTFDFIVSRAVTDIKEFTGWVKNSISPESNNKLQNGILYLKGEDAVSEIKNMKVGKFVFDISQFFTEEFFLTKKIVYLYNL